MRTNCGPRSVGLNVYLALQSVHLNRDVSGCRVLLRCVRSLLFSFGLLSYKQRIQVAKFLGTECVNENISVFLQKCTLYPSTVKVAGATFSLQNLPIPTMVGNAGAQVQVARIRRFSLEGTQFLHLKKTDQAEISECGCSHLPLQDSFFTRAKNKTAFALLVSSSLFHCLQPPQELGRGGDAEVDETGLV